MQKEVQERGSSRNTSNPTSNTRSNTRRRAPRGGYGRGGAPVNTVSVESSSKEATKGNKCDIDSKIAESIPNTTSEARAQATSQSQASTLSQQDAASSTTAMSHDGDVPLSNKKAQGTNFSDKAVEEWLRACGLEDCIEQARRNRVTTHALRCSDSCCLADEIGVPHTQKQQFIAWLRALRETTSTPAIDVVFGDGNSGTSATGRESLSNEVEQLREEVRKERSERLQLQEQVHCLRNEVAALLQSLQAARKQQQVQSHSHDSLVHPDAALQHPQMTLMTDGMGQMFYVNNAVPPVVYPAHLQGSNGNVRSNVLGPGEANGAGIGTLP